MQGAAPLASPRLNPGGTAPQCRFPPGIPALDRPRHLQNLPLWYPAGGLPPPPLALFLPPIPPPPFPAGEGGWGDGGQKRQLTAGQAGDKESPPPAGYPSGRSSQCRKGSSPPRPRRRQAPTGYLLGRLCKCRRRFNAGVPGAKPPAKYTLNPPFPTGEGGWGDRGQKRQLTAGQAGDKESPLPVGYPSGRSNKCRPGFSPRRGRTARRVPQRQRHAAPRRKTSPYHLTHNIKNDRIYAQIQANHKRKKGKYW